MQPGDYTPIAAIGSEVSSLQTSTFSKATADFINSWILECQTNHPLCGPDQFSLLHGDHDIPRPRRLLDVKAFQDPGWIRLVEAENLPHVEYCALSYSWGFSKPFVLTSVNIVDFCQQIHVQELPKTIRDAIEAVREIDYRYLWIDALCIMQDGRTCPSACEDWEDQAGKLNDIFSNSVITIAASESFDGETGFIQSRNPLNQIICRLQPETGLCYDVVPPCTPHCLAHPFNNAQYHLDTRAWVFQERILAPRTAHITRNFLHLECRTELVCEAMQGADACHHSGAVPKADYQNLFSVLGLGVIEGLTIPEFTVPFFLSTWHGLVRRYSMTNLSRSSDILVALAGLAKQIQRVSNLTWSFGLWREYLLRDLLWYVRGGKGIPALERAPSWSWASIKVRGPQILYEASVDISPDARITSLPEISAFTSQAPLSEDESRYAIKLMVLMKAGAPHLKEASPADSHPNRVHRNCQGISKAHPECPFHPDYELSEGIELYSILIARVSGADRGLDTFLQIDELELGLVLTPVRGFEGRYRRVGYFHRTLHLRFQSDGFADRRQPSFFDEEAQIQEMVIV